MRRGSGGAGRRGKASPRAVGLVGGWTVVVVGGGILEKRLRGSVLFLSPTREATLSSGSRRSSGCELHHVQPLATSLQASGLAGHTLVYCTCLRCAALVHSGALFRSRAGPRFRCGAGRAGLVLGGCQSANTCMFLSLISQMRCQIS